MRKKRKRGSGRPFVPGPDPRRHRFTKAERKRGYKAAWAVCMLAGWEQLAWLSRKVRASYNASLRGQEPDDCPF